MFSHEWYEDALVHALSVAGHQAEKCRLPDINRRITYKAEHYLGLHSSWSAVCLARTLESIAQFRPQLVFMWRPTQFCAADIKTIRSYAQAPVVAYNNDDAFSPLYRLSRSIHLRRLWRMFLDAIPAYDLHLVYRRVNIFEYLSAGARVVRMLMPYFLPWQHHPICLSSDEFNTYGCDVVFVGHHERDHRQRCIEALARHGHSVFVYGHGWPQIPGVVVRKPLVGLAYTKALAGGRICLSFLSKLNRDTYTRRSFEIPACGQFMLSERTEDLTRLFEEGKEADFFSDVDECQEKAARWLRNSEDRRRVAAAGRHRCENGGHDIFNRVNSLLAELRRDLEFPASH
jgi:spore maturation protein CgeB